MKDHANCTWHAEVYDAEYQALYVAAGFALADALREKCVDRYDTIRWHTDNGETGSINLDFIQANGLSEILALAGVPRVRSQQSSRGGGATAFGGVE